MNYWKNLRDNYEDTPLLQIPISKLKQRIETDQKYGNTPCPHTFILSLFLQLRLEPLVLVNGHLESKAFSDVLGISLL